MEDELIAQLIKHEGLRLDVYKDTMGYPTIGVGRNLQGNPLSHEECDMLGLTVYEPDEVLKLLSETGITKEQAILLLKSDIEKVEAELDNSLDWFSSLPDSVKIVLIDMAFNMGIFGLLKFKKSLALIKDGNYSDAGDEILDSAWSSQVGNRSIDLSYQLKSVENTTA